MEYNKIKRTITVYVPGNLCNMRCSYCYISQNSDKSSFVSPIFNYSVEHMIQAFSPKRLGGICNIVVIGSGETLYPKEIIPFVHGLLHMGHVVEVITNLTLNNKIDELLSITPEDLKRLLVKGSLHWLELKRLNKIDDYFSNMRKVIAAGASSFPFLVIGDNYMPYLNEIKETCKSQIGALPHCTPCDIFDEAKDRFRHGKMKTQPECNEEFTNKIKNDFDSKVFGVSTKFLDIDPRKVFCYAGLWSFIVHMDNGNINKCHGLPCIGNFFEDINTPIELEPVGYTCGISSCSLQYNFIAQGLIPEIPGIPTCSEMLERKGLINDTYLKLMDFKYFDYMPMLEPSDKINLIAKQFLEIEINSKETITGYEKYFELFMRFLCQTQDINKENLPAQIISLLSIREKFLENKLWQLENSDKSLIIWGTGGLYEKFRFVFKDKVEFFIDSNPEKENSFLDKHKIYSPNKLKTIDKNKYFIFIASSFTDQIEEQLQNMGFIKNIHFFT